MKRRNLIILFVVCAVMVIALFLWRRSPKSISQKLPLVGASTNNLPVVSASHPSVSLLSSSNRAPQSVSSKSASAAYHDRVVGLLSAYNDVPIDFYGRLEDQHGDAVPYATIKFIVRVDSGNESAVIRSNAIADGNGMFSITGYHGQDLSIYPSKTGYSLATTGTFFKYSRLEDHPFTADVGNPILFKMWKLGAAEPLISINQKYRFHYSDAPIDFDFLTGKMVQVGGDLRILVKRSPGIISGQTRQDWGVQIDSVDGGLIEDNGQDGITFEAPESGYQLRDTLERSTNAPSKWMGGIDQNFFIQSRKGQVYSKIKFGISINQDPDDFIWVEIRGVANTNWSRNWEATAPK